MAVTGPKCKASRRCLDEVNACRMNGRELSTEGTEAHGKGNDRKWWSVRPNLRVAVMGSGP